VPGEFCWINMLTPDPAGACAFFGELLGWTFAEMPGMGYSIKVTDRPIGGLFDLAHPNTPSGTPPLIGVMVKVESADRASEKVAVLGGTKKPPFDIMEQGRMAVCFDPTGAEFDVWEPKKGPGMDVDGAVPGAPSWFEAHTSDVDETAKFYTALFGWTAEPQSIPAGKYTSFRLGREYVRGVAERTGNGDKHHWVTYFTVADVNEAARTAERLGGMVRVPAQRAGDRSLLGITSRQGVPFAVFEYGP
jgi:predicted enzyme related to lactoylglutathione lyase